VSGAWKHRRDVYREEGLMPLYLTRTTYTPETWAKMVADPEDRRAAIEALAESIGGRCLEVWYAFGVHDTYALIEAPGPIEMAGALARVAGSGAFSRVETTPLLSVEEMLEALHMARDATFAAPGE
jgi:uncharacterized protein with GYD domain